MNSTRLAHTLALAGAAGLLAAGPALAQGFDSGSDGSEGALTFPADAGTIVFDPASYDPPLDPDGDGVYHLSQVSIGANTVVRLTSSVLGEGRPVVWLVTGDVTIEGTLDLSGEDAGSLGGPSTPAAAGAGGYVGGLPNDASNPASYGNGPGGGAAYTDLVTGGTSRHGGGGSYGSMGGQGSLSAVPTYGNPFLLPLVGGSGGGAGYEAGGNQGVRGGGGSGALLIASNTHIAVTGSILADGGNGSNNGWRGGAGSGGAIRLVAPRLSGSGTLSAAGGASGTNANGGLGRIRLESFRREGPTNVTPVPSVASPGLVFLPPTAPLVRLVSVDGVAVAASPTGSFEVPDAVISNPGSVAVQIEANNIPPDTEVTLTLRPETGPPVTEVVTLSGTLESSTATANVTFSSGFTRLFLQANWTP